MVVSFGMWLWFHWFNIAVSPFLHSEARPVNLSEIFNDTIVFNDLCTLSPRVTSYSAMAGSSKGTYRHYARAYSNMGNEFRILFHFMDSKDQLFIDKWNVQLDKGFPSDAEDVFVTLQARYNGEEYASGKVSQLYRQFDKYSDVTFEDYSFHTVKVDSCGIDIREYIQVSARVAGKLYNEKGNRIIHADDVLLQFQIQPFDTIRLRKYAPGSVVSYKPTPRDPLFDIQKLNDQLGGYDLDEMDGNPCLRWEAKVFLVSVNNGIACRLPEPKYLEALKLEGSRIYNPFGTAKPPKGWIWIPATYRNDWLYYAKAAEDYIKE